MDKQELLENLKKVEEELKAIQTKLEEDEDVDVEEVEEKTQGLIEEKRSLESKIKEIDDKKEKRSKLLSDIAEGRKGNVINQLLNEKEDTKGERENMDNKLYRSAFLKELQGNPLTAEERAAFIHTTENSKAVIPTETANKIFNTFGELHPIVADVKRINSNGVFRMIRHTEIVQGDAKVIDETKANDDEQNTFVDVVLAGKKISKHVRISYELKNMAIDAFEDYLVQEIGQRIEKALADHIITTLKDSEKGIATANVVETTAGLTIKDVLTGLGSLKNVGNTYVYANRADIYGDIALLANEKQSVNFITDLSTGVKANLLGNAVKQEDSLAKGEVLILDANQFVLNVVSELEILRDRDITTGDHTIAGHLLAEGALENPYAGALIKVTGEV